MKKLMIFIVFMFVLLSNIYLASADVQDDFLILINQERANQNISPLSLNEQLETAGQLHSQDMIDNDYFSHTSLDNRTASDRIIASGYNYIAAGENIAYHSGNPSAETVFNMWKNSSGHYLNMMNSDFTEMGLGIATGDYTGFQASMYTLDLGKRDMPICNNGSIETRQCGINIGMCEFGIQNRTCNGFGWSLWSSCIGGINPSLENCTDELDNDCDGFIDIQDSNCIIPENQTPIVLRIINPENNSIQFSQSIKLNVTLSRKSKLVNIFDNGRKIASCLNCGSFSKTFYFSQGRHIINIESFDEINNKSQDNVNFLVYIPNLRISSILPTTLAGKTTNFSIIYSSSAPISAKLKIISSSYQEVLYNNCSSGNLIKCQFFPSIPDDLFERANITFELEDQFGVKISKLGLVNIDTKKPELNISYTNRTMSLNKYIYVSGKINERSKVEYLDKYNIWKTISSSCLSFSKSFSFPISQQNTIQFRITDLAGNQIQRTIVV